MSEPKARTHLSVATESEDELESCCESVPQGQQALDRAIRSRSGRLARFVAGAREGGNGLLDSVNGWPSPKAVGFKRLTYLHAPSFGIYAVIGKGSAHRIRSADPDAIRAGGPTRRAFDRAAT
jgi:hypothetical protein